MTPAGWTLMLASWTLILILFLYSLARTLRGKAKDSAEPKNGA
jgi:hypothetical protein